MIAVDTNILVYAHRGDSPSHAPAAKAIAELAERRASWAIPWPCIHEFLAISTHPRIYDPPTPAGDAIAQVEAWLDSPSLVLLGEGNSFWPTLTSLLTGPSVLGPRIHDARIAALCLSHDVGELWSADRDFSRFPIRVRNPLVGQS